MNRIASLASLSIAALAASSGFALAGISGPAPLLGAGLPGLAVLGVAGGGYLVTRVLRKKR